MKDDDLPDLFLAASGLAHLQSPKVSAGCYPPPAAITTVPGQSVFAGVEATIAETPHEVTAKVINGQLNVRGRR